MACRSRRSGCACWSWQRESTDFRWFSGIGALRRLHRGCIVASSDSGPYSLVFARYGPVSAPLLGCVSN
ncbi:hypothetical protein BOS5A_200111 [Bosea sp. EC-HK365B]|nr:hypothetical protein BOSE21B_100111 [Bosea sp. 21B]CAD5286270.1 hypothetical protein BOSE7B_41418 [Bosea sp. 7B]VVT57468.1 hypothetical protein BOS5A_200111 [Bosea sp. EC-HK365B]VXC94203.1 hypothetical protein BOSE127_80202 [Bosea sp. 127]